MGRRILTGRYVPDSRVIEHEPAGIYEDPVAPGVNELRIEPLSVITFAPRQLPKKRKSAARKIAIVLSAVMTPVMFVALADSLAVSAGLFFGSFAAAIGWPMFVFWANYRD